MASSIQTAIKKNEFGKIPLPWVEEEVKRNQTWENTHAYWLISQSWHGLDLSSQGATVGDALHDCNEIMESNYTGPKLFGLVSDLRDDIILYGTKKRKRKEKRDQIQELAKAIIL